MLGKAATRKGSDSVPLASAALARASREAWPSFLSVRRFGFHTQTGDEGRHLQVDGKRAHVQQDCSGGGNGRVKPAMREGITKSRA